jgi:hypothetical protein
MFRTQINDIKVISKHPLIGTFTLIYLIREKLDAFSLTILEDSLDLMKVYDPFAISQYIT